MAAKHVNKYSVQVEWIRDIISLGVAQPTDEKKDIKAHVKGDGTYILVLLKSWSLCLSGHTSRRALYQSTCEEKGEHGLQ